MGIVRETRSLLIAEGADSNPTRSRAFANSRLISFFLFNLIELLFGRVLASFCEAQLLQCKYLVL